MIFAIGTKVILKFTGETGRVSRFLDDNMYLVQLDESDLAIPVFVEDLQLEQATSQPFSKTGPKPTKSQAHEPINTLSIVIPDFENFTPLGFQLAFEPIYAKDGLVEKYQLYVLNDTFHEVIFQMKLSKGSELLIDESGKLADLAVLKAGTLLFDDLNEHPTVVLSVGRLTTEGVQDQQERTLQLKPSQFFKKLKNIALLDKVMHHYVVFERLADLQQAKPSNSEDLLQYTKEHVKPINFNHPKRPKDTSHKAKIPTKENVFEFASFPTEIDLHIEKLYRDYSKLSNTDIIKIQLMAFEKYFQKAKNMGIEKFYVIHGVGKGKLKEEIWKELDASADVLSYKNEYHHKYGYGATEVVIDYR